jgi:hypothetical protein
MCCEAAHSGLVAVVSLRRPVGSGRGTHLDVRQVGRTRRTVVCAGCALRTRGSLRSVDGGALLVGRVALPQGKADRLRVGSTRCTHEPSRRRVAMPNERITCRPGSGSSSSSSLFWPPLATFAGDAPDSRDAARAGFARPRSLLEGRGSEKLSRRLLGPAWCQAPAASEADPQRPVST